MLLAMTYWIFFRSPPDSRMIGQEYPVPASPPVAGCDPSAAISVFKASDQQVIGGRNLDKVANHQIEIAMLDLKLV